MTPEILNKKRKAFLEDLKQVFKKHDASIYFSVDQYMAWDMDVCIDQSKPGKYCFSIDDVNGIDADEIDGLFKIN